MSVTWHGVDGFLSELDEFADSLPDLPEKEQAGELLADAMRAGAPRKTGALADSVRVLAEDDTVSVFPTADHAAPVIVGVPSRQIGPNPFPDVALQSREAQVVAVLEQGVEAAVRRAGL